MDLRILTTNETLREHKRRLDRAAASRRANEAYRRMKIRISLRKAILETIRSDGDIQDLAAEFAGLVRSTERRLDGRPCC